VYIGTPVRNKGNGQWTFYLSRRLNGPKGEFIGLALVGFSSTFLSDFYGKINLGSGATVSLYRRDFTLLARWPHTDSLMGKPNLSGSSYWVIERLKKRHDVVQTASPRFSADGEKIGRLGAVRLIAAASVEQEAGIEQINKAISEMDAVTHQNAALVEEAAAAAGSLQE
jgi:hypothetical protein